nr:MAG TPA: major capsid protein [Caudoviricetes sp.]
MNIKERIQTVLQKLKLLDKAKANQLTDEEWKQIVDSYQKEYQSTLQDDLAADMATRNTPITQEQMDQVQGILDSIVNPGQNATQDGEEKPVGQTTQTPATGTDIVQLAQAVQGLVNTMQNSAAEDRPIQTVTATTTSFTGPADRTKFLFGIENPMFSMSDRWNRIAANPESAASFGAWDEETEGVSFRKQAVAFSRSLQKRYAYLHANGMLDAKRLAAGEFATNYEGVNTAGVGNQYVVLRQDALIARVLTKRDLTQYFPVRYGIQDHDLVFNAFFSEVSQAYQQGEIWKGDMKLENEMGHVDDAMIKLKFGPMKELERMYIGYLNKEGSDPIKWSMIEFCILNSLETAQVEQNKRRMRGIYVKPETGVAGSYLNASTGVIYTLLRYVHEFKILPHDDEAYRSYTDADMLDAVQDFVADIITSCTEDMDIDNHVLYLNKTHQPWWIKNVRAKYGKDIDFTGPDSYKYVVPDTNVHIVWLPYLGQLPLMFMDVPGNIQFLEYVPGEMLSIKVKEDMELIKAWSTWKEGCAASFTGRRFDSLEKLKANNYEWQQIFMNKPAVDMEADAATVDASKGFWQITVANTAAKAITDITNAKAGVAYIIECGSTENATTIAKAGKFADITEAYTPTKVGDYIMLILNSKGNFLELERQVAGVRKVNAALQPNIPGVR